MASPSHTSGRSPPKESGPAHPQFANCPACAAKWTRPPGAGWAPGASRGRSSGLSSVLAVKKTNTLNGRFLLPRPTFQARRRDWPETKHPCLSRVVSPESSGTLARAPRSEAARPAGSGAAQPPLLSHARSRPRPATQYPRFLKAHLGPRPRDEPRALRPGQAVLSCLRTGGSVGRGSSPSPPPSRRFLLARFPPTPRDLVGLGRWASRLPHGGTFRRERRGK